MKNLFRFMALMLALLSVSGFGQLNIVAKPQKPIIVKQPNVVLAQQNQPDYVGNFNRISEEMNRCRVGSFLELTNSRRNLIVSINGFPEQLSNYMAARSFVDMDNRLLDCATGLIDSLVNMPAKSTNAIIHDTIFKDVIINAGPEIQQDCTQSMTYLAIGSGSIILVLLLLLYKFVRAHKIFKDLYEKIYDKILDELAEKLIVGLGIKEDEKYKEKIKKLVELNQSRKKGEMKLQEYLYKVDVVLD